MNVGKAKIDFEAHQIIGPKKTHAIEPKVMEVLRVLVDNAGQVVTREDLIDQVWGVGYGGDERLSRAISLLRKALGDKRGKNAIILTIPKTGYKLLLPKTDPVQQDTLSVTTPESAPRKRPVWLWAMAAILISFIGFWVLNKTFLSPTAEPPLVMIMDSAHPARIYDEEMRENGATNADILSDILADLPIRTQKELISPTWHRFEAVKKFEPDLIVIHYSGFKQEDARGDRPQLRLLVDYFENTDTKFLVYSRAGEGWLKGKMDEVLAELYADNPDLKNRIFIFPLLEYGEPEWMDPGSSQAMKLRVKELLELE